MHQVVQAAPGAFQLLEVRVVHDLVELGGQLLVDLADPVLDVGLDVLGDDLARLDDLVEELLEVVLGALRLLVGLRPGGRDDLVEQARGLGRSWRPAPAAWACSAVLITWFLRAWGVGVGLDAQFLGQRLGLLGVAQDVGQQLLELVVAFHLAEQLGQLAAACRAAP